MVLSKNFVCNSFYNMVRGLQLDKEMGRSNSEGIFGFEFLCLIWLID